MQRICWILSLGASLLVIHTAAADELTTMVGNCPCQACAHAALSPAPCNCGCQGTCHSGSAYNLAPGCCEPRRHCFDNAWDGYCQERAKWDTFCCKLGTGALYPCTHCTHDGRGVALEAPLRPSAAACQACAAH
jgi:hypothetical protein